MLGRVFKLAGLFALLLAMCGWARPATATPSYDNCTGFVDTLPASPEWYAVHLVDTPGTWCLRADLASPGSQENFILVRIMAADVTLDCKGHTMRASDGPVQQVGILAGGFEHVVERVTVRNCRLTNFDKGIGMGAPGADPAQGVVDSLVEGNEFFDNAVAIDVGGDGSLVRGNRIVSGSYTGAAMLVVGRVDVVDNRMLATGSDAGPAIEVRDSGGNRLLGNTVVGYANGDGRSAIFFQTFNNNSHRAWVQDNVIVGRGVANTVALACYFDGPVRFMGNVINGYPVATEDCIDAGDNDISP